MPPNFSSPSGNLDMFTILAIVGVVQHVYVMCYLKHHQVHQLIISYVTLKTFGRILTECDEADEADVGSRHCAAC